MDPKSVPNAQSVPNVVQNVKSVHNIVHNAQEQEFNKILRELNLGSLPPNVKNALDLDFILEGDYIFLGAALWTLGTLLTTLGTL